MASELSLRTAFAFMFVLSASARCAFQFLNSETASKPALGSVGLRLPQFDTDLRRVRRGVRELGRLRRPGAVGFDP